jgi:hypothetical protein
MTGEESGVADGRYTAVVDRFERTDATDGRSSKPEELAVLLLESGDSVVAERAIPTWRLPEDGRQQDAVLQLTLRNGHVVSMTDDPETTERRTSEAQSRFDRLAERPGDDSDEGNDEA